MKNRISKTSARTSNTEKGEREGQYLKGHFEKASVLPDVILKGELGLFFFFPPTNDYSRSTISLSQKKNFLTRNTEQDNVVNDLSKSLKGQMQ